MRYAILTKRFTFEASHQLPDHGGKCARLHGHSYCLEVSLRGPIREAPGRPDNGMVCDFSELSQIVREVIVDRLDHQFLNDVLPIQTTAENLCHWIWEALIAGGLEESLLYRVRLWETASSCVEITQAERVGL